MVILLGILGVAAFFALKFAAFSIPRQIVARAFGMPIGRPRLFGLVIRYDNPVSPWATPAIVLAGMVGPYLLAALFFCVSYVVGGVERPGGTTVFVVEDRPAAQAGMHSGDRIVAVAGAKVDSFAAISAAVASHAGEPIEIVVARDGSEQRLEVTPLAGADRKGKIGIGPDPERVPVPFFEALSHGIRLPAIVAARSIRDTLVPSPSSTPAEVEGPVAVVRAINRTRANEIASRFAAMAMYSSYSLLFFALLSVSFLPARRKDQRPALEDGGAKRP